MKKQVKQSTVSTIMAITSCTLAVLIFISGMITALLFVKVTELNDAHTALSLNLRTLVMATNYQKDMARSYTQDGAPLFLDMYNKEPTTTKKIDTTLETIERLTNDDNGMKQLEAIVKGVNGMRDIERSVIETVGAGKLEEARAMVFGKDYGMMIDGLNSAINEFEEGMNRGIGNIIKSMSDRVLVLGVSIEILCVLLILVQVTNALMTKKYIIKPLVKLRDAMMEMCSGNLNSKIDVVADHTEIGQLAGAMTEMRTRMSGYVKEISFVLHRISQKDVSVRVENTYVGDFEPIQTSLELILSSLGETFTVIRRSIDQVSTGAGQVSGAAQGLAQGATEQADSVEQLSHYIEKVSQQIRSNAANATATNDLAMTAGNSLKYSNQQMQMMIDAMSEISSSSHKISKIIKTIEDIAFQTNILALNAAVEAARAGAAGKGFAVVADEVRNLATKSSEAAKQTNALIEGSVISVENGVKIADGTARSLSDVVTGSMAMTDLIAKIAGSCEEQSLSINDINLGVAQISTVVQTNSATSEQNAAASQELYSQANLIKSLVDQYKI